MLVGVESSYGEQSFMALELESFHYKYSISRWQVFALLEAQCTSSLGPQAETHQIKVRFLP